MTVLLGASIDHPAPAEAVERSGILLQGWALCAPDPVSRVEISVDGGPTERARLGVPRPDLEGAFTCPEACLGGFEHPIDLGTVPPEATSATVRARVVAHDGTGFDLPPSNLRLAPLSDPDPDGRAAQLRARTDLRLSARQFADSPAAPGELRLLALAGSLQVSGPSLSLVELLQGLALLPHLSCSVVATADGPLRWQLEASGIPVHICGRFPTTSIDGYEGRIGELAAWLAPQRHDLLLSNTLRDLPAADLARRLGVPCVWAVHATEGLPGHPAADPPGLPRPAAVRERMEAALAECGLVIVECEATRRALVADAAHPRVVTIPPGIDAAAIERRREEAGAGAERGPHRSGGDGLVVLGLDMVGSGASQALATLAWSRVSKRHPDARLMLASTGPEPAPQALRRYLARAGLEEAVRIPPAGVDRHRHYAAADILVAASVEEPLPRTVLEAMSCGVPVVCAAEGGLDELVEDGRSGWLVAPGDLAALEEGLERALAAGARARARVARHARGLVRSRFPVGPHLAAYEEWLRTAAGLRPPFSRALALAAGEGSNPG